MKNQRRVSSHSDCPAIDVMLRCRAGFASKEEEVFFVEHRDQCQQCQNDYKEIDVLRVDLLAIQADRLAIESFQPSQDHARICMALSDQKLRRLALSDSPPSSQTYDHLDVCPYCRQRLVLEATINESGSNALISRSMAALLEPSLAAARSAVVAVGTWDPIEAGQRLFEKLCVRLDTLGHLIHEGMEAAAISAVPAYATMDDPTVVVGDESQHDGWKIPLAGTSSWIRLEVRYSGERAQWGVRMSLEDELEPEIIERFWLTVVHAGRSRAELPLANYRSRTLWLNSGAYELAFRIDGNSWAIPIVLGLSEENAA